MTVFCEKCGSKLVRDSKYCEHCGASVAATKPSKSKAGPLPIGKEGAIPSPKKAYRMDATVIASVIVGLLILSSFSISHILQRNATQTQPISIPPIKTLYTTKTTNVRSCASTDCQVIGTYPPGQTIDNAIGAYAGMTSLTELPDWYPVVYTNSDGTVVTGYINSTFLTDRQNTMSTNAPAPTSLPTVTQPKKTLPEVIAEWSPSVALIVCTFSDGNGDAGSGFLTQFSDRSIVVITNKHVITDETTGYGASSCSLEIPGDGSNYYTENTSAIEVSSSGFDWGVIYIADGDSYFNTIARKNLPICQQQAQTGDSVVVLGYPDYAGQFSAPTATQGIISGYAPPYYTTSAQIESGNSGGIAVDPTRDCYVGIPSAVQTGNYANLGRILNANVPFQLPY